MQEKCILFDLDGTLTDPFRGITRSVQYSLEKFGIHAGLEELKCFIGPPLIDSYEKYFDFRRSRQSSRSDITGNSTMMAEQNLTTGFMTEYPKCLENCGIPERR